MTAPAGSPMELLTLIVAAELPGGYRSDQDRSGRVAQLRAQFAEACGQANLAAADNVRLREQEPQVVDPLDPGQQVEARSSAGRGGSNG
jgi:hypothetical protein